MALTVNGETVPDDLIRAEAQAIRPKLFEAMTGENPADVEARVKEWARENVIERVLLRQAAGGDAQVEAFLTKVTENVARPRNKDITEYYRKNKESFFAPEMVHAAHIIKNVDETNSEDAARAAIEKIEQQLLAGADFAETADAHSDCPGRGGDLGVFPRGEMVPEFEAVVFALEPGQLSPIFRTTFGFHIAKVIEKRAPGVPKLEEIREQLDEVIYQQKRQKVIEQYLDRLRAKAEVSNN